LSQSKFFRQGKLFLFLSLENYRNLLSFSCRLWLITWSLMSLKQAQNFSKNRRNKTILLCVSACLLLRLFPHWFRLYTWGQFVWIKFIRNCEASVGIFPCKKNFSGSKGTHRRSVLLITKVPSNTFTLWDVS
jgi:hypothetical protein